MGSLPFARPRGKTLMGLNALINAAHKAGPTSVAGWLYFRGAMRWGR
jgi:hypothetical protein